MTGRDGPLGFRPFTGVEPSRDGARGIAGAVYLLLSLSSHPVWGVLVRGKAYCPFSKVLAVLVLEDAGDSAVGEKYDSPIRDTGDCAVCTLSCLGGAGSGNCGGGARARLASECVLSLVTERARRLLFETLRAKTPPELEL